MFALSLLPGAAHASREAGASDTAEVCPPSAPTTPQLPRAAAPAEQLARSSIFTPTNTSRLAAPQGWFERSVAQTLETETGGGPTGVAASTARLAARLRSDGFAARSVRVESHMLPWGGPSSSPGGGRKASKGMTLERLLVLVDVPTRSFSACVVIDTTFSQAFQPPPPRASEQCLAVLAALPDVYVGNDSSLLQLLKFLAAVLEESYTAACLSVPPWRTGAALLRAWGLGDEEDTARHPDGTPLMVVQTLDDADDLYDGHSP